MHVAACFLSLLRVAMPRRRCLRLLGFAIRWPLRRRGGAATAEPRLFLHQLAVLPLSCLQGSLTMELSWFSVLSM